MAPRKPDGVRRSARFRTPTPAPVVIDLTSPIHAPKNRVTKSTKTTKKAPPRRDCATCDRNLSTSSFPKRITEHCNHSASTCKACVKAWIPAQLDSKTYDKLSCPECPRILQNEDVKKLATKPVYERFDELQRRGIAETVPGWRWCLSPHCRAGQVHQPLVASGAGSKAKGKKKSSAKDDICECNECGAKACVPCDKPYHEGETCAANRKRIQNEDKASLKIIEKKCKKCPGCSKNIEKSGGCDQVICTQCRTRFCFLCLTDYNTINKTGHASSCMYAQPGRFDSHADHLGNMVAAANQWVGGVVNRFWPA